MDTLDADAAITLLEQVAYIAQHAPSKHLQRMTEAKDALEEVIPKILAPGAEQTVFQNALLNAGVNPATIFTAAQAATLVTQVADIFFAVPDGDDKRRTAEVLGTLIEVVTDLFAQRGNSPDSKRFEKFVAELAAGDQAEALKYVLSVSLLVNPARCLNNGSTDSCGGPPQRYNMCDLCKRSGTV